jgi:hypothetical protein
MAMRNPETQPWSPLRDENVIEAGMWSQFASFTKSQALICLGK